MLCQHLLDGMGEPLLLKGHQVLPGAAAGLVGRLLGFLLLLAFAAGMPRRFALMRLTLGWLTLPGGVSKRDGEQVLVVRWLIVILLIDVSFFLEWIRGGRGGPWACGWCLRLRRGPCWYRRLLVGWFLDRHYPLRARWLGIALGIGWGTRARWWLVSLSLVCSLRVGGLLIHFTSGYWFGWGEAGGADLRVCERIFGGGEPAVHCRHCSIGWSRPPVLLFL